MRKRVAAIVMALAVIGSMFGGCKRKEPEEKVIRVMALTSEVPNLIQMYLDMHPELGYTMELTYNEYADGDYWSFLDASFAGENEEKADIYIAVSDYAAKYVVGSMSTYAATYDDLGIPTEQLIEESQTAVYAVEAGTRTSDGKVVALPYTSEAGCFIYRRSIAKEVWGTDDPVVIQEKIGGGSGTWDAFWNAAEKLKEKGYAIVSGDGDLYWAMHNSMDSGWIEDGELRLSPNREAFLDISKRLRDNGYSNGTVVRSDEWRVDIAGNGEKEVFGFIGPSWMIHYEMSDYCGDDPLTEEYEGTYGDWAICNAPVGFHLTGTWVMANKDVVDMEKKEVVADIIKWMTLDYDEDSLQYLIANGLYEPQHGEKFAVVSGTVMESADGSMDFLSGQDMFEYYRIANDQEMDFYLTEYNPAIEYLWQIAVREYAEGKKTREEAIAGFKAEVKEKFPEFS